MVSTAWVIENIKKTNHWFLHREYAEKALSEFLEFGVPMRIKYPNLVFKDLIDTQHAIGGGRGTEPFDSKEKMTQVERQILGIIGSKFNSASRNLASRATFPNSINTNTGESNPNFSMYTNKIKAEKQKIIDIENARLAEIKNKRILKEEFEKNARLAKIERTRILKEDNDLLEEQLLAKELQRQVIQNEIRRNSIFPTITPAIDPAVLPSIVASSSLLPLGILTILLLNSSRGKK